MPKRIQRRCTKGWRAPDGAVYVGRGSKWGNPLTAGSTETMQQDHGIYTHYMPVIIQTSAEAAQFYDICFRSNWNLTSGRLPSREEIRRELAGKDLMCWCPVDQPCHADTLLRIANEEVDTDGQ
ncbi:DUF4326 domain-containing protein [Schaalia cardiffensis]|uniref:DUF4326 domain-containing protein n=1 Tax=Schaalia cardiffensis TaxID=181487 RepID=UPI0023F28A09|nr:DUF4326 domain-containing protein [Schaalia cardiffensis]